METSSLLRQPVLFIECRYSSRSQLKAKHGRSCWAAVSGTHIFERRRPLILDCRVVLAARYRCKRRQPLAVEPPKRPNGGAPHERRTIANEPFGLAGKRSIARVADRDQDIAQKPVA